MEMLMRMVNDPYIEISTARKRRAPCSNAAPPAKKTKQGEFEGPAPITTFYHVFDGHSGQLQRYDPEWLDAHAEIFAELVTRGLPYEGTVLSIPQLIDNRRRVNELIRELPPCQYSFFRYWYERQKQTRQGLCERVAMLVMTDGY